METEVVAVMRPSKEVTQKVVLEPIVVRESRLVLRGAVQHEVRLLLGSNCSREGIHTMELLALGFGGERGELPLRGGEGVVVGGRGRRLGGMGVGGGGALHYLNIWSQEGETDAETWLRRAHLRRHL